MAVETVLIILMLVVTTANVSLWAFGPHPRRSARLRRLMVIWTAVLAILLPAAGVVSLVIGDSWDSIAIGAVALACWPATILALRKHSVARL